MFRRNSRIELMVLLLVVVVSGAFLVMLFQEVGKSRGPDCKAVSSQVTDRIASRSIGEPIVPIAASGVRSPWIENRLSDAKGRGYYVIAMRFVDSAGSVRTAMWGVETAAPLDETELEVRLAHADSQAIVALDENAQRATDWRDYAGIVAAVDEWTVADAFQCLSAQ